MPDPRDPVATPAPPGWASTSTAIAEAPRSRRTVSLARAVVVALLMGGVGAAVGAAGGVYAWETLEHRIDCSPSHTEVLDRSLVSPGSLTVVQSCSSHFPDFQGWDQTSLETLFVGAPAAIEIAVERADEGVPVRSDAVIGMLGTLELPAEIRSVGERQAWFLRNGRRWRRTLTWGTTEDGSIGFLLVQMSLADRDQR